MKTRTKVILGVVLFFPVLVGISFVGGIIWGAIDPEGQEKARMQNEANKEAEEARLAEELYFEEKIKENEQRKEEKFEAKYENLVLNYKGKDGKGFSIKDFSDARCRDNQQSFADYGGDDFDGKYGYHEVRVFSPVNTNLNPPCLGATWYFGVNNQGNVIAWEYDSAEEILDYLDTQGN